MNRHSFFLLALMPLLTSAQSDFTAPGSVWHVAQTHPAGSPEDPGFTATTTRLFFIAGDSTVNGAVWSVFVSEPTHPDDGPLRMEGLARTEDEIVLGLREDLTTDTLYDFSLGVGDSTHYLIDDWYATWLHVTAIDSVIVDGGYRHVLHFEDPQLPPFELQESWIEGIGSVHGPLFPARPVTFSTEVPGDSLMLTCYGIEDILLWTHPGYADCAVNILLGTADGSLPGIRIFPNPASDHLSIELPTPGVSSLRLLDNAGRTLLGFRSAAGRMTLPIGDLAGGPYVVEITDRSGMRYMGHWIKE